MKHIIERAIEVQKKYQHFNRRENKPWGAREYAEGLVGDVGDLMKFIQAREGFRQYDDLDAKIKNEIADCLWAIIVVADQLGIDLQETFLKEMDKLETRIERGEG